jgi:hypothetical protein
MPCRSDANAVIRQYLSFAREKWCSLSFECQKVESLGRRGECDAKVLERHVEYEADVADLWARQVFENGYKVEKLIVVSV